VSDSLEASMMKRIGELKAEVERLNNESDILQKCCEHQKNRIERLKAEVERLTKAGDTIISILCKYVPRTGAKYALMDWRDAKEGKQP
jgi:phage host-nuclease inhibitor protein Gam